MEQQGYIYIMINAAFPKMVKIGKTARTPEIRAKELFRTGLPTPYEVVYDVIVTDIDLVEKMIHNALADCRVREEREFFAISIKEAIKQLETISRDFQFAENSQESAVDSVAGALQLYEDPELKHLQIELKILENELLEWQNEKLNIEKQIQNFNTLYYQELGGQIELLLRIKAEYFQRVREQHPEKEPDYQEAKRDYEHYQKINEAEQKAVLYHLNEEEEKEQKAYFREASRLCHPDMVANEIKQPAAEIFNELKTAYDQNDLAQVKAICEQLKSGTLLESGRRHSNDKEKLRATIERLFENIQTLKNEIDELKNSDVYQTLTEIHDWARYFAQMKENLQAEIEQFEEKLNGLQK